MINADDFYGKHAFDLLLTQANRTPNQHLLVAYQLQNTLSDFGSVNRGLCLFNNDNQLIDVTEYEDITKINNQITGLNTSSQQNETLSPESLMSMNCWFFTPDIIELLTQALYRTFKNNAKNALTTECYLPSVVMKTHRTREKKPWH